MNLLQRSIEIRDARNQVSREKPPLSERKEFVRQCLLEYHGIGGISVVGQSHLYKDLMPIVWVEVTEKCYTLTIYRAGRPHSLVTDNRDAFVGGLVEGMSHHL